MLFKRCNGARPFFVDGTRPSCVDSHSVVNGIPPCLSWHSASLLVGNIEVEASGGKNEKEGWIDTTTNEKQATEEDDDMVIEDKEEEEEPGAVEASGGDEEKNKSFERRKEKM